jgi:hypothetical protein
LRRQRAAHDRRGTSPRRSSHDRIRRLIVAQAGERVATQAIVIAAACDVPPAVP